MFFSKRRSWKPGQLARSTMTLGTGLGLRYLFQAAIFVATARILGSESFGVFSATVAVAGVCGNFSGLGGQVILLRNVARAPSSIRAGWAMMLTVIGLGLVPLMVLYLWASRMFLAGIAETFLVPIGISELAFGPVSLAAAHAYQGLERMGIATRIILAPILARLLAVLVLALVVVLKIDFYPLVVWGWLYALASAAAAAYAFVRLSRDFGLPRWGGKSELKDFVASSFPFSVIGISHKLHGEADKFLLTRFSTYETAGTYSAGYRVVDFALLPLQALIGATVPRLFRAGSSGLASSLRASMPIVLPSLLYSVVAGIVVYLSAPLVVIVLGSDYEASIQVIRLLALLPLATLPRLVLQAVYSSGDRQYILMVITFVGALLNVILSAFWIRVYGWEGAAAGTYVAEGFISLSLVLALPFTGKKG